MVNTSRINMQQCQLCGAFSFVSSENALNIGSGIKISDIIASCKKYIFDESFQTKDLNIFSEITDSYVFCDICHGYTVQVLQLDNQLEVIKNQIKQLMAQITEQINSEREKSCVTNSDETHSEDIPGNSYRPQTGGGSFPCSSCYKIFSRLNILKRHNCETVTYECETCGKSFSSTGSLRFHQRTHSGEKPHKCETCEKCFSLPHQLRTHRRIHLSEKYICAICQKVFTDVRYLTNHNKLKHSEKTEDSAERNFRCDICSMTFTANRTLKLHLIRHTGDTPHKCQTCGQGYGTAKLLQRHEVTHSKEKHFQCDQCLKMFITTQGLKLHMTQHGNGKPFQCTVCDKGYFTAAGLKIHNEGNHQGAGVTCEICGKLFKTKTLLFHHKKTHISKNDKNIKCVVCERTYTDRGTLIWHQKLTHFVINSRTFVCESCGRKYDDYPEYLKHYRRFKPTTKQFLKCQKCTLSFRTRCDMIFHFNEKHSQADYPIKCCDCKNSFLWKYELSRHNQLCHDTTKFVKTRKRKSNVSKPKKTKSVKARVIASDKITNAESEQNTTKYQLRKLRSRAIKGIIQNCGKESESESEDDQMDRNSSSLECLVKYPSDIKEEDVNWIKEESEDS